jgi:hypothetical protein
MNTKRCFLIYLLALIASSDAAPIVTSLSRLDADQTPGSNEAVFTFPLAVGFGGPVYQDYSFTYSSWPSYLNGAEMVRMVNTDAVDGDYQLQLTLSQPATVFLLIDDRTATEARPWVAAQGFQDTGDTVMVWEFPYSVYAVVASAGPFTVRENGNSFNMYTVAVIPEPSVALLSVVTAAICLSQGWRHRRGNCGTAQIGNG